MHEEKSRQHENRETVVARAPRVCDTAPAWTRAHSTDAVIMIPIFRNILSPIVGFVVGSVVNVLLVNAGPHVVSLPEGADVSTMEGLRESMVLFEPVNFLFPFLGHALGTLTGAFIAAKLAASHKMKFAVAVGVCFLLGGIMMVRMLGGPLWFNASDLLLAYIPMAYLGGMLAGAGKPPAAES